MGKCSWVSFERGAKTVLTFVFSHVGLCALVVGYSIAGAFLFNWLEQGAILTPYNSTQKIDKCIEDLFNISERYLMSASGEINIWKKEVFNTLLFHDLEVADAAKKETYDKTAYDLQERWGIINSLFYCVTVITTIGYGHISPATFYGRLVTIFYSIFGIPLMLLCLNNIGDSMATTFRFTYRRLFCSCKKSKPANEACQHLLNHPQATAPQAKQQPQPQKSNKTSSVASKQPKEPKQPKKTVQYKPNRKHMLISPPISATIHRGSDHPPTIPSQEGNKSSSSGPSSTNHSRTDTSTQSSSSNKGFPMRSPQFSPNLSPCLQMDVNTILNECATYTGTPIPGFEVVPHQPINNIPNADYDHVLNRNKSLSPPPSPVGVTLPSTDHSNPSSPIFKVPPAVWFSNKDNAEGFLSVPMSMDGPCSVQSSRPGSPSIGWADQTSIMSASGPSDNGYSYQGDNRPKRATGKTLVVYNTLSGDALKQQTKIQRKMAMNRIKQGQSRNDATTVFTDPVSGQPVVGDMLGLNYRPIELEPSDKDTRVPMTLVLAFVFSYLLIGALLFSSLEEWNFFDSLYFCFITLSTIGFGDLVPGNLGYETRQAQIKLVALSLYLLLGLAVLAMSFSLVQEEVVLKCKAFAQYIGLKDE